MTADRKTPTVGFWITVVLVVLMAYPLSWGPACRLVYDEKGSATCPAWVMTAYEHCYEPIFVVNRNSETAYSLSHWYLVLWGAEKIDDP